MVITSRESGGTTMIKSVPPDLLYLCAELVTGKSVPVLVGITRLPIGQALAWAMVTLGAVAGTLFSVYASRRASGIALLGFVGHKVITSLMVDHVMGNVAKIQTGPVPGLARCEQASVGRS
jgi:hypothetical protein